MMMPPPTDLSSLKVFFVFVQFYGNPILNLSTITEPFYSLTKRATRTRWGEERTRSVLTFEKRITPPVHVLVHFNPSKTLGLACDAFNFEIGPVLFHSQIEASAHMSMCPRFSRCKKELKPNPHESLAIIFGMGKFKQYL